MTKHADLASRQLTRSTLVLPATDWKLLEQAARSEADRILIDLDDLVAPAHKPGARQNVIRALIDIDWGTRPRAFRMNALGTEFAYRDLIEVVVGAGQHLDLLLVPKVEQPQDVKLVESLLTYLENEIGLARKINLEIQIESAAALLFVREIAAASPRLEALVFGPGDYAASMGFPTSTADGPEPNTHERPEPRWSYALHQIAVAARAAGLRAIDGPYADLRDPQGFARSCREARALGYDGKWCLDPHQVTIANQLFLPTAAEIRYALEVVEAYDRATTAAQSLVTLGGVLIDAASLRSAHLTINRARQAGLLG